MFVIVLDAIYLGLLWDTAVRNALRKQRETGSFTHRLGYSITPSKVIRRHLCHHMGSWCCNLYWLWASILSKLSVNCLISIKMTISFHQYDDILRMFSTISKWYILGIQIRQRLCIKYLASTEGSNVVLVQQLSVCVNGFSTVVTGQLRLSFPHISVFKRDNLNGCWGEKNYYCIHYYFGT